jgi:actin-related protein 3
MSLGPSTRAVVIDNGSGYTKAGYAGNVRPDYVFPTAIAAADEGASEIGGSARDGLRDLDFCLGDLAVGSTRHTVNYPVRHGLIENWTNMERVWQRCFFEHLRCDPEDAYVVLVRGGLMGPLPADGAAPQPPREPRVHCRGHV